MKKKYINPSIEIVKFEVRKMIAGSLDPGAGTGSVNEEQVITGTPGESRGSLWDDEEDY